MMIRSRSAFHSSTAALPRSGAGPVKNLSFEREFGKIIGSLDLLSKIIADKTNRIVAKVFQNLATAIFLPVKF